MGWNLEDWRKKLQKPLDSVDRVNIFLRFLLLLRYTTGEESWGTLLGFQTSTRVADDRYYLFASTQAG